MTAGSRVLKHPAVGYASVLGLVLGATALRAALHPWFGSRAPFLFYLPVVLGAAWTWGLGPGILALVLAELGAILFVGPSFGFTMPLDEDWFTLATFVPVGAFLIFAAEVARRARREAEIGKGRLDQALRAAKMSYWNWDIVSDRVSWSENLEAVHGLRPGSFDGNFQAFLDVIHPDDAPRLKEAIDRAVREGVDYNIDFRVLAPDGGFQWINGHGHPVVQGGKVIRMAGIGMNVTGHHAAEEAQRYLAAIVSSSEDAIISKDLTGRILSWNAAAERLFGYRAEEVVGRSIELLMPPESSEDYRGILARIARGERVDHYETRRRRKDGTLVEVALTVSPVRDESGTIVAASKTARDLTALREFQRERERTRELFLATLGHDLRNPLNTITASLFYLQRHAPDSVQPVVARMSSSSDRMARMIGQLLDFTRSRLGGGIPLEPKPADLRAICASIVEELEIQHPNRVRLTAEGDFSGEWDADRLAQVFSNLIANAIDHGSPAEPIGIALSRADSAVHVEVSNGGAGISEAMRAVIFEPFRRGAGESRGPSRGLGLGLYITREIVRSHGGAIEIDSPPGKVVFTVKLPVHGSRREA